MTPPLWWFIVVGVIGEFRRRHSIVAGFHHGKIEGRILYAERRVLDDARRRWYAGEYMADRLYRRLRRDQTLTRRARRRVQLVDVQEALVDMKVLEAYDHRRSSDQEAEEG